MSQLLRVLIIEDSEFDALIMVNVLEQGGYQVEHQRVETPSSMRDALRDNLWDVILSDYNLPDFNALEALELLKQSALDIPFIIISGGIGEDVAVAAMKSGAHDYLMKGNLARLVVAVERELGDAAHRRARRQAEEDLRENEMRYRLLWENSNDGVVLTDDAGWILFSNPAIISMFGLASDELKGRNIATLVGLEGDAPGFSDFVSGLLSAEVTLKEYVGVRKNRDTFPLEISCSGLEMHGRRMHAAFLRDISERKQAQMEIKQHEERLEAVREIQQWMFPKVPPSIEGYDIAGVSYPADAAGGDHYDYLVMRDGFQGFVVADVAGHGMGPAMLMSEARAYLRMLARRLNQTGDILTSANEVLGEDLSFERYITVILLSLEAEARRLTFSNAGHPPGMILDASGAIKALLKRQGVPLGIQPNCLYPSSETVTLTQGDLVFLYTDGFDEAMSEDGNFFGMESMAEVIHEHRQLPATQILECLRESVVQFTGNQPQADDLTGILIKVL
jgi:sigma-B regulation protein RsbU (phosphoserine phosphatase)